MAVSAIWRFRQHDMIGMAAYLLMAILAVVVLVPG